MTRFLSNCFIGRRHVAAAAVFLLLSVPAASAGDENCSRSSPRPASTSSASKSPQSDADRQKGLMFRKELPEGQGMLFDFKQDQDGRCGCENT